MLEPRLRPQRVPLCVDKLYATRRGPAAHPKSEGRSSELELGVAGGEERTPKPKKTGADSEETCRTCSDPSPLGEGGRRPG